MGARRGRCGFIEECCPWYVEHVAAQGHTNMNICTAEVGPDSGKMLRTGWPWSKCLLQNSQRTDHKKKRLTFPSLLFSITPLELRKLKAVLLTSSLQILESHLSSDTETSHLCSRTQSYPGWLLFLSCIHSRIIIF